MDVAAWLQGLGLEQYETLFRENDIDAEVLSDLTEGDLEKIGVSLGHRKRLLKDVAALAGHAPGPPAAATPTPQVADADAERRPITVMFCDLVGSTSLAAKLDAEDWRNLVNAYLDAASAAVTALGGHVLKKLGDGLMALFGYPQAQENDAERAVRAALAIQRALADINARNVGRLARSFPPASASRAGRSSWRRPAKCSATRQMSPRACRPRPSRERCWSPRPCSDRSPGSSSPRTRARANSKAFRSRSTLYPDRSRQRRRTTGRRARV